MKNPSEDSLPLGTTAPYARMHRWLKRFLIICMVALVFEGAFAVPLLAIWYGAPSLSLLEICNEFKKIRFSDETQECIYPYPLFAEPEAAGQTTAQDQWGIQPVPKYQRIGFRELVSIRDERIARQAAAAHEKP